MNTLTTTMNTNTITISSLEIASITGKTHKNVIRDIREMLEELSKEVTGDGSVLSHEEYQEVTDNRGYTSEILLNKHLTEVLVTGYSITLRSRVIKRLHELESAVQQPRALPTNFKEALLLLKKLRDLKILQSNNTPYATHAKYFKTVETYQNNRLCIVTLVKASGQQYLINKLSN